MKQAFSTAQRHLMHQLQRQDSSTPIQACTSQMHSQQPAAQLGSHPGLVASAANEYAPRQRSRRRFRRVYLGRFCLVKLGGNAVGSARGLNWVGIVLISATSELTRRAQTTPLVVLLTLASLLNAAYLFLCLKEYKLFSRIWICSARQSASAQCAWLHSCSFR